MARLFKWSKKTTTKNSADNNINISTNTDIMFNIGKDLGKISSILNDLKERDELIVTRLDDHEYRIKKLEKWKIGGKNNGIKRS